VFVVFTKYSDQIKENESGAAYDKCGAEEKACCVLSWKTKQTECLQDLHCSDLRPRF
jgi:hypothetical protein